MPEELLPPVVAVVATSDPGPWLEECLASLQAQDYGSLSVLVVDVGSAEPVAARVAQVAPDAYLYRLEHNTGFGPAVNVALSLVTGASHLLVCHDDVVLAPDATRRLVEEAFRSNAGIVGPKLVDYDEPDRILQLGVGVDRFGAPIRRVERREFDQAQHDEVQAVFAVPGGATLIRFDLFEALGGFDPEISMFGEDVDFCWRARLAGARVIVVPQASVRHHEATSARLRPMPEARALQWRHELRAVLKNYGRLRRTVMASELVLWSAAEMAYFFALGRRSRIRQVVGAWRWNLAPERGLREARAKVAALRRVSDHEVARLFTARTFRAARFFTPVFAQVAERRRRGAEVVRLRHRRDRRPPEVNAALIVVAAILIFGSRSLVFSHLPLLGGLLPFGSAANLIGHFLGGWQDAGLQRPGPASPAFLVLGVLGIVLGGSMSLVVKLWIVGAIVAGSFGVARLVRAFGPPTARAAAAIAYLFLPLAWDDLGRGDLIALFAYGVAPYLVQRLLVATGLAPFGQTVRTRRGLLDEVIVFAAIVAVAAAFVPTLAILVPFLAVALAIGCAALGDVRAAVRAIAVTWVSTLAGFVLLLPWSATLVGRGISWSALTGAASDPMSAPQLGALLRLELGPLGAGVLGLAPIAAALFVLVAADASRFGWAVRLWTVLIGSVTVAWAGAEGWLGPGAGELRVLIAPYAVALAALIGLGVAALIGEVRASKFNWRHLAALGFAVCLGAGVLPVLGGTLNGRWSLPGTGYDAVLGWTTGTGPYASTQTTLWLGDPSILPLPGWQIAPGLAAGLSNGLPDGTRLFLSANPSREHMIEQAVLEAESGATVRLGAQIAAAGVRYIVLPSTFSPVLSETSAIVTSPPPQLVLDGLTAQSDLHELPSEGGALIFENTAWHAGPHGFSPGGLPAPIRTLFVVLELLALLDLALFRLVGRERRSGAHGRHVRFATPDSLTDPGETEELAEPNEPAPVS